MTETELQEIEKLLPCPFCGGAATLDPTDDSERIWFIGCTSCGCATDTSADKATPVQEWNRRDSGELQRHSRLGWEYAREVEERVRELQRQIQERETDAKRYKGLRDMLLDTDFGLYVRVGEEWGPVTQIDELDSIIDDFATKEKTP